MPIPEISSYLPSFASNKPSVTNPIMQSPMPTVQPFLQKREVEYVVGFDGANTVPMAPNSSGLFLDRDNNLLWVVATDQNGTKSLVKGYHIGEEYVPPKPVTLEDIMSQMQSMNERLNKMEVIQNGQSNFTASGQGKSGGPNAQSGNRRSEGYAGSKSDGSIDGSK